MIKISIITVVLNRVDTIEQCIKSVINQSYKNIEYIVIDGGSIDGTVDIIKKYSNLITYWCSESDRGIYNAFNKGIKVSTGDYILFLGADDSLYNNTVISDIVKRLSIDVDILCCGRYDINEELGIQRYYFVNNGNLKIDCNNRILLGNVPTEAMFVKRIIRENIPFDESYQLLADYKLYMQYLYDFDFKISYLNIPVSYFALSGASSTRKDIAISEIKRMCADLNLNIDYSILNSIRGCWYRLIIKTILKKIGIYKLFLMYFEGWKEHTCHYEECRWCKKTLRNIINH